MAKKSAFESLTRLMEDGDGDLNIDVTIIADADAETAEEIIEVQEQADEQSDADEIVETEDEAQQEAEDMVEMALVLRQHGLTPGMAAVMQITMPLAAYGITMPALESLDSTGRNMAAAERIAAALEASSDGFWAGTKKFFSDLWEKIKGFFRWVFSNFGKLITRVERAKASLKEQSFDSERAKDKKFKKFKKNSTKEMSACCDAIKKAAQAACTALGSDGKIKPTWVKEDVNSLAGGIGLTLKADEKDSTKFVDISNTDNSFVETEDVEMSAAEFENCKTDKWEALDIAIKYKRVAEESKDLKMRLDHLENWSKSVDSGSTTKTTEKRLLRKDVTEDVAVKDDVAAFRKECTLLLKVQARCNKIIYKYCGAYVSACGVARSCAAPK